jgi:head-tail adaptor
MLRERISIEGYTEDVDTSGGLTNDWPTLFADIPADVEPQIPLNSSEAMHSGELIAAKLYKITARWTAAFETITANHRVNWHGRRLAIVSGPYNVDSRNREMVMICQEGVVNV